MYSKIKNKQASLAHPAELLNLHNGVHLLWIWLLLRVVLIPDAVALCTALLFTVES